MLHRRITSKLIDALSDRPVVLLHGSRQSGKTTLVRQISEHGRPASYFSLDDANVLAAATDAPQAFIANQTGPVAIDEVQRAPALALAIKAAVDRDRRPGRFLLTGSANVMHVPRLADSLAGRMEILTLWPLSQSELEGAPGSFIDGLFSPEFDPLCVRSAAPGRVVSRVVRGGYPEPAQMERAERRSAWFESYVNAIVQRDVRDMANIEGLTALPRLLRLLASRAACLLNYADVARDIQWPQSTLKRYCALLESAFLIHALPAWSSKLGQRLVKASKLHFCDAGLLVHLLGADEARLMQDSTLNGRVTENFVMLELMKEASWSRTRPQLFHYRTSVGREVDLVLESPDGRIVGIEVKSGMEVDSGDFRGLKQLAGLVDARFVRGLVLYAGEQAIPFGDRLAAIPIQSIWSMADGARG